jgi:hypothetical protein
MDHRCFSQPEGAIQTAIAMIDELLDSVSIETLEEDE